MEMTDRPSPLVPVGLNYCFACEFKHVKLQEAMSDRFGQYFMGYKI